jgi:hypothetical protein
MSVHRRVEARDRGLHRVSRLTSMTLSGGLVLSGGFAALSAHAYAGNSRHAVRSGTRSAYPGSIVVPPSSNPAPGTTAPAAPLQTPSTLPQSGTGTTPQTSPRTAPQTVPQTVPQTIPQYYPPDTVVSGGS